MKTIGLIGGMSWESSAEYYRIINRSVQDRLGGVHSASILMTSFDFAEIEILQREARWDEATAHLIEAARTLERGGVGLVLICANTMHRMFDAVEASIKVPMIHIADATADQLKAEGFARIGLLGTAYTMEQDFYRGRLASHGLDVLVPDASDRAVIHRVIFDELVRGLVEQRSRDAYRKIIGRLVGQGAEAIVLGCTELSMLVKEEDSNVPLFDTATIHAQAAVDFALAP